MIGKLDTVPALSRPDLLAAPVVAALNAWAGATPVQAIEVAAIDPDFADTAEFCARYDVALDVSANCVVVSGRRGADRRTAACVVLATTHADVNGLVRQQLGARKASFAAMDDAVRDSGMEYGGITPVGLPGDWPVLVDEAVTRAPAVVIGSGIRGSKLVLPGAALAELPSAVVLEGVGVPIQAS